MLNIDLKGGGITVWNRKDGNRTVWNSHYFDMLLLFAYGAFISQPIRHARAYSSYKCFILRVRQFSNKLVYGRYGDLIQQYESPSLKY